MEIADPIAHPLQLATEPLVRGTALADLARLYDPDVMVVTAPTAPGPGVLRHAAALADGGPRQLKAEVPTPGGVPDPGALASLARHDADDADAWIAYLEEVATVFAHLLDAREVGVRQVVADGPHCPRFHVDQVLARGVLNVLGSCTEWLGEADVDRGLLGHAGGADDATSGLVRAWGRLGRAELGALTVFKGTAWPGAEERAVVHRSPPPNGERRVVLTLDWLD